ncbi:MAG: TRAP transporter TatT component family protein [Bryobacteraceae bacterium]
MKCWLPRQAMDYRVWQTSGKFTLTLACAVALLGGGWGCSVRRFAVNRVGDALASGGSTYASDDDLQLVGDALPFGLKLIESLLAESPRHRRLLQAACEGFTSYTYLYVHRRADELAGTDLEAAGRLRTRARRLYLRAHRYGLRAMEVGHPGIGQRLVADPKAAAAGIRKRSEVPILYWTAASLGLAISVSKNDAAMLARLPEVEALLERALELEESWQEGTLHEFAVVFAGARPGQPDYPRVEKHYRRALELSQGKRAGLFVSYAEASAIPRQDRQAFESLLKQALAVDPDAYEAGRLQNIAARERAAWLLEHADEFILPPLSEGGQEP